MKLSHNESDSLKRGSGSGFKTKKHQRARRQQMRTLLDIGVSLQTFDLIPPPGYHGRLHLGGFIEKQVSRHDGPLLGG